MNGASVAKLLAVCALLVANCSAQSKCLEVNNNVCTRCAYGFADPNGNCTNPAKVISGCYVYGGEGVCVECQDGYYHNTGTTGNATCTALNDTIKYFCRYSTIDVNTCSACMNSVLQNGGGCIPGPTCADPACESCYYDVATGNQYCRRCKPNHALWLGINPPVCVPVPELPGCDRFYTRSWCARCLPGTYYSGGFCLPTSATNFGSAGNLSVVAVVTLLLAAFHN